MKFLEDVRAKAVEVKLPSVVICDVELQDMNGLDIVKALKVLPEFSATLRIAVSHDDSIETARAAHNSGAHAFLSKERKESEIKALLEAYPTHWIIKT